MESYFSVFFFKTVVHEVSIKILSPADSAATFDQQREKDCFYFIFLPCIWGIFVLECCVRADGQM